MIRTGTGKVLIVTEDGLEREVLDRVIEASHRPGAGEADAPVVLPRRVFAYLIRVNNPYFYSGLLSKRIIVFGTDPLAEIAPPGRGAFAAYTLSRIAHTLAFTRSDTVFSRSEPLSLADCETSLERANAVRLLFRDDWISPHRPEVGGALEIGVPGMRRGVRPGQTPRGRRARPGRARGLLSSVSAHRARHPGSDRFRPLRIGGHPGPRRQRFASFGRSRVTSRAAAQWGMKIAGLRGGSCLVASVSFDVSVVGTTEETQKRPLLMRTPAPAADMKLQPWFLAPHQSLSIYGVRESSRPQPRGGL